MFQFEHIEILWLLCLVPLLPLIMYLYIRSKRNKINNVGEYRVFSRLFEDWSSGREWLRMIIFTTAMVLAIIAWANPQWGSKKEKVKAWSSDVIIALDISQSMLAEDVSPNRMERAKRFVVRLIKALKGERIGLIYFAGSAYLQMPLSNDYATAELFVKAAGPRKAGTQGTVITEAIELSDNMFDSDEDHQKALIIISDGENHESEAIEAAARAHERGSFIYTLGIGSDQGAFIPITQRGQRVYKKDKSGQPVKTTLNKQLLKEIAEAGGGEFYMIDRGLSAVKSLKSEIDKIEKREVEQRSFTDYNSYFQYFLFLALLLLFIEYFIPNFSKKRSEWKNYQNT